MHEEILGRVIFSPGRLCLDLADGLVAAGHEVALYTPGPVPTRAHNVTADLGYFERELAGRGDGYLDLLKKHPLTFVTLARQVQAEVIARAYADANAGQLNVVHIYMNEEDLALPFSELCTKPVVFTHHDPFNFLVKYKNVFPKYADRNWISMSMAQRRGMPADTRWVANIYHGLDPARFSVVERPADDYVVYVGRIIEAKGVHLAIAAAREAGVRLVIVGKHYSGGKDQYWQTRIAPELGPDVKYVGFIDNDIDLQELLGNARALVVPSVFEEPFGMVMIEALACGTPVVGLDSGAIGEVVRDGVTGVVVARPEELAEGLRRVGAIDRAECRREFESRFTLERMVAEHEVVYVRLAKMA